MENDIFLCLVLGVLQPVLITKKVKSYIMHKLNHNMIYYILKSKMNGMIMQITKINIK